MRTRTTNEVLAGMPKMAASKADLKRDLEGVPDYNKDNLVHLISVLTHTFSAFTGVKGAMDKLTGLTLDTVSPDGKLGGRGFVMSVRDIKELLAGMQTNLSNIKDTLFDEFNNPGWGLSKEEKDEIISLKDRSEQETDSSLTNIDDELKKMLTDDDTEGTEGDEGAAPEGEEAPPEEGSEEDTFPDISGVMGETPEETPEATPKTASSSNKVFVGMRKQASPVAKAIASRVLNELVKRASESKPQTLVGENK
jgi:hypothetical protein